MSRKSGSIRVGQAFGIEISLHVTFLLLLAVVGSIPLFAGGGVRASFELLLLITALFSCVLLHELGHALMARRFGIKTRDITLLPIGGVASLERLPDRPRDEILVAIAGPGVNALIAIGLAGVLGVQSWFLGANLFDATSGSLLVQLMWMNVILGIFNLMPAFPMDGGRVLRALLAMRMGSIKATRLAAKIGQALAVLLAFVGILNFQQNPLLLVVAGFIFFAASTESKAQELRALLDRVPVHDAMAVRFQALEASDSISRAVAVLLSGVQQDFPVTFNGRVVGLLTRADLLRALSEQRQDVSLWMVMRRDVPLVDPDASLNDTLLQLQAGHYPALPVVDGETLVGFITLENIREMAMVRHVSRAEVEDVEAVRV